MSRICIKQHDSTDCGVACLASVLAFYELGVPLAQIRKHTGTDKNGTTLLGLLQAAQKLGLDAKGIRCDWASLHKIPKPAIVHISFEKTADHYVVVYKVKRDTIVIMDPADGRMHKRSIKMFKSGWSGVAMLLFPNENFKNGNHRPSVMERFWYLLKPHRAILLQAFVGALVYTLLGFSTAIYIQKLTDFVWVGGNRNLLNLLSIVMIILLTLQILIVSFKDIYLIRTGQLIDLRLILGYYKHLLKLPQQFFDTMQVGEILSRINDAVKIRTFINTVALNLAVNSLIVLFSFALMFAVFWKLALLMLLIIPLYLSVYLITNCLNKKTERQLMEASATLESQLVESLSSIRTIKNFGLEGFANIQTEECFVKLLQKAYRSALNYVFSMNSTSMISALFTIILLWSGSGYVLNREITPGELFSFYAILGYFTGPVSGLIKANKEIQSALIAADRLFEIIDLEIEKIPANGSKSMNISGDILFRDVSFAYTGRPDLFTHLDLCIPEGKITALLGESGSGKSTIVHILQKLYPIQKGKISIGGVDLSCLDVLALRECMALVPQEIHLFSGSVVANIAVGDCQPDMERIIALCTTLGLMGFIEHLPDGFHTHLGENGALVSGGQKQRIAIARALYKDAPILVMDEATSSLDSRSEYTIHQALRTLQRQQKTILLITHRLSSVPLADTILVIQGGRVVEAGQHEQLYAKKGPYYHLWQRQLPPQELAV